MSPLPKPCLLLSLLSLMPVAHAESWRLQNSPVQTELRGLSVVSDKVVWASGAKGTVIRSLDGETWQVLPVPGAEALDFRDIEAFSADHALIMSAGPGEASTVWRTRDGGKRWTKILQNSAPNGFWDAMSFADGQRGALFGDPVDGRFQVFLTDDAGASWRPVPATALPEALANEGAFAASGSCIAFQGRNLAFVTGGAGVSRVFVSRDGGARFTVESSPIAADQPSRGLFSVTFDAESRWWAVGGDYKQAGWPQANISVQSAQGGVMVAAPAGFLSAVTPIPGGSRLFALGLNGSLLSDDAGRSWRSVDATPFNAVGFASANAGWAVGPKGRIGRWQAP